MIYEISSMTSTVVYALVEACLSKIKNEMNQLNWNQITALFIASTMVVKLPFTLPCDRLVKRDCGDGTVAQFKTLIVFALTLLLTIATFLGWFDRDYVRQYQSPIVCQIGFLGGSISLLASLWALRSSGPDCLLMNAALKLMFVAVGMMSQNSLITAIYSLLHGCIIDDRISREETLRSEKLVECEDEMEEKEEVFAKREYDLQLIEKKLQVRRDEINNETSELVRREGLLNNRETQWQQFEVEWHRKAQEYALNEETLKRYEATLKNSEKVMATNEELRLNAEDVAKQNWETFKDKKLSLPSNIHDLVRNNKTLLTECEKDLTQGEMALISNTRVMQEAKDKLQANGRVTENNLTQTNEKMVSSVQKLLQKNREVLQNQVEVLIKVVTTTEKIVESKKKRVVALKKNEEALT